MKAHGIRFLGLIAATVIAAEEQGFHLQGMNKADKEGFGALMGDPPGRPRQCSLRGFPWVSPAGTLAVRRWFAMYVAFHNDYAVVDTNERRQVARIQAGQPPRAMVYLAGAARWAQRESRAVPEPGR